MAKSANTWETLLVVDDNATVRGVVAAILKNAHYEVLEACSGANAIDLSASYAGKINLMIANVNMAAMSGPTVAACGRSHDCRGGQLK